MPYTSGPYELFPTLPSPDRPTVSSSRSIDFASKTYVDDGEGNFEAMPSTAQRVLLLCAFARDTHRPFITPQDLNATKFAITNALRALTSSSPPVIDLESIEAVRESAGTTRIHIKYRDLTTGLDQTVEL